MIQHACSSRTTADTQLKVARIRCLETAVVPDVGGLETTGAIVLCSDVVGEARGRKLRRVANRMLVVLIHNATVRGSVL